MTNSISNAALSDLLTDGHTYNELRVYKWLCEQFYTDYVRIMFRMMYGTKFILNWHHALICETIERVLQGEIMRLIINCPPGYGKTELCVRMLLSYVLIKCAFARSMHLSSSAELAWLSSRETQDIIQSPFYQLCWPMAIRDDIQAKRLWRTSYGGGLIAGSTGGQVTGFRAGRLEDGFNGVMAIDDPIKPEDAVFELLLNKVNRLFANTIRSRLARQAHTPIIIIMQRVHDNDLSGFLLRGGSKEKWHHLLIPAEFEEIRLEYPQAEYSYGIPIEYEAPCKGPLWPWKEDQEALNALKLADEMVYSAQYMQQPTLVTGEIFKASWWPYYKSYDSINSWIIDADDNKIPIRYKMVYGDTAMKKGEHNDYTVFICVAKGVDGKIYLIDLFREKLEVPDLESAFEDFCAPHEYKVKKVNTGIRARKIEDKASGIGLIQGLNRKHGGGYIQGIPRDKDKISRAKSGAPSISQGLFVLPLGKSWVPAFISEHTKFNSAETYRYDDQVDCSMDAIHDMILSSGFSYRDVI